MEELWKTKIKIPEALFNQTIEINMLIFFQHFKLKEDLIDFDS